MGDKPTEIPKIIKDPFSRQYLPSGSLGSGGFAAVFRAAVVDRHEAASSTLSKPAATTLTAPPSECALKVVVTRTHIKSRALNTRLTYELSIHSKIKHPHIVRFYRAFAWKDLTYVSLELCDNGSLTDVVRRRKFLTMPEIRRYAIQLCGAVSHLHTRDVVHRDIKAGNVFLDADMNVKLGDFGLAALIEPSSDASGPFRRTTFCGTPNYLAPELLSRRGHDKSVDIWAIGILLYYLAVGKAPFHAKSKEEIYERVKRQDYTWPAPAPLSTYTELDKGSADSATVNYIPQPLKDLVGTLLVPEERRPPPLQLVQHPFFTEGHIPVTLHHYARHRRPRYKRGSDESRSGSSSSNEPSLIDPPKKESKPGEITIYDVLVANAFDFSDPLEVQKLRTQADGNASVTAPTLPRKKRKALRPVLDAIAVEVQMGVGLQIPLPEDAVYAEGLKRAPAPTSTQPTTLSRNGGTLSRKPQPQPSSSAAAPTPVSDSAPAAAPTTSAPVTSTLSAAAPTSTTLTPAAPSASVPTSTQVSALPSSAQSAPSNHLSAAAVRAPRLGDTGPKRVARLRADWESRSRNVTTKPVATVINVCQDAPTIEDKIESQSSAAAKDAQNLAQPSGTLRRITRNARRAGLVSGGEAGSARAKTEAAPAEQRQYLGITSGNSGMAAGARRRGVAPDGSKTSSLG